MIAVPSGVRVVVATKPVDFRRGMESLVSVVQRELGSNPFCGDIFVFRSKRSDRVKIIGWDGTGLWLFHKHLEKRWFTWPPIQDGVMTLSAGQLTMLLEGLDWSKVTPIKIKTPIRAC